MHALMVILTGLLLLLCLKMLVGDRKFVLAERLEKQAKFREACYFYGVAVYNGSTARGVCEEKIRELWKEHGPFDYADIDAAACRLNAQGHSETLKIIMEAVKKPAP